jgi:hypothetical protein
VDGRAQDFGPPARIRHRHGARAFALASQFTGGTAVTDQTAYRGSDGHGWLTFAGIMVIIVGALNVIWGIAAIDQSTFFVGETKLVFQDVKTWGWIVLFVGVLEIFAGFGIFARNQAARWFGIVVASLNLIAALLSINAYPTWGLIIVLIDILIIYGLAAHGHKLGDA